MGVSVHTIHANHKVFHCFVKLYQLSQNKWKYQTDIVLVCMWVKWSYRPRAPTVKCSCVARVPNWSDVLIKDGDLMRIYTGFSILLCIFWLPATTTVTLMLFSIPPPVKPLFDVTANITTFLFLHSLKGCWFVTVDNDVVNTLVVIYMPRVDTFYPRFSVWHLLPYHVTTKVTDYEDLVSFIVW